MVGGCVMAWLFQMYMIDILRCLGLENFVECGNNLALFSQIIGGGV